MERRVIALLVAFAAASGVVAAQGASGSAPASTSSLATVIPQPAPGFVPAKTPWGDPDLQGIWPGTEMVGVPLQRPQQFGTRNVLTEQEFQQRVRQAQQQNDTALADVDVFTADVSNAGAVGSPTSPPPHWLERGKPSRQASLIVDPPDGRQPAQTSDAQKRAADLAAARRGRGPADSYADRSLYDRCITRGPLGSILPVIYNNGNEIVQAPGYVVLRNEMIHETRVIPLDGRPHLSQSFKMYMGDSRGHWEGNTLVVETKNLNGLTSIGGNGGGRTSDKITLTERFTLLDANTLQYTATMDDPGTWTRPWTISFPWRRDQNYGMFEYACHEGNYAMRNILSAARADERSAGK